MSRDNCGSGQYVVAHVDLLGAKQLIKKDNSAQLVRKIYDNTLSVYNRNSFTGKLSRPNIKIFSDNIAIYNKVDAPFNYSQINCAFVPVILFASAFQLESLKQNVLARGGIALGDFYADEIMIWGEALARADYLEKEIAIYPRIIIDPVCIDNLEFREHFRQSQFLMTDLDGLCFVDYVNTFPQSQFATICNGLKLNFDIIKERAGNDIRALQKVAWYRRHLDSKLEKI